MAFQTEFVPLSLEMLHRTNELPVGAIDCTRPMLWALEHLKEFDVFIIVTAGKVRQREVS